MRNVTNKRDRMKQYSQTVDIFRSHQSTVFGLDYSEGYYKIEEKKIKNKLEVARNFIKNYKRYTFYLHEERNICSFKKSRRTTFYFATCHVV